MIDTTAADVESTFKRAWALLASNPIVVVPPIVVGIAAGAVVAFGLIFGGVGALLAGTAADNSAAQGAGIAAIAVVVAIVLALILVLSVAQAAFTAGMAGAAWQTGKATLADGWNAFRARGLQMFVAMLLLALVGCAAVVLAPVTLLLSLVAYVIFTLYVSASVIVGGRTAGDAIAESFRLAKRNFWPTTAIAVLLIIIAMFVAGITSALGHMEPYVGGVTAGVLQEAVTGYATLVVIGEYLKLKSEPAELQS